MFFVYNLTMKKLAYIYLPFLFLIYVAVEVVLKLNNFSICDSTGCSLADNLLKFDSIYLNYAGVLIAVILVILGRLAYKNEKFEKIFLLALYPSILFETIMIVYQYWANPEMCKFCMGVYAFLIAIAFFSSLKKFLFLVPFILANVAALSFLDIPKAEVFVKKDDYYLIQSATCVHCKRTKAYLKERGIEFTKIDIDEVEPKLFLNFLDIHSIPVLVVNDKDKKIISGEDAIKEYFANPEKDSKKEPREVEEKQEESSSVATPTVNMDTLFNQKKDDCGFDFTKIEKCDDK